MEKLDDRCTTTKVASSSDASRPKAAAGIAVYLVEELGDARLRCAQLKQYVSQAQQLIEQSSYKDHFFEVAAHLIRGVPDALFRLEKALDAAAMSAARMDYEEIKQNLKPEKAEELETVLQDARVRLLQRRSGGVPNGKAAAEEIRRIAAVADATGQVPVADVMVLLAALERGGRTAGSKAGASDRLREMAAGIEVAVHPSRIAIAQDLRAFLAAAVQPTAAQSAVALMQQANSREEVMKGFKESNPSLTDEQLKRIADEWEKNKSVVKDKTAVDGGQAESSHHAEQVDGSHHAEDEVAAKKASERIADAVPSLANGGRMLALNRPAAVMMIASGVCGLGEAFDTCGMTAEAAALKHAGEQLQNVAKNLSTR